MEFGTIEREIHIDATPEIVFEVISRPEHIKEWWSDDAVLDPTAGGTGELIWHGGGGESPMVAPITVVESDPPRTFSFRWVYDDGVVPGPANSNLVTFELVPTAVGTTVRLTETGFRERGWEIAVLEAAYQEHSEGWDKFIPLLGEYVVRLVSAS